MRTPGSTVLVAVAVAASVACAGTPVDKSGGKQALSAGAAAASAGGPAARPSASTAPRYGFWGLNGYVSPAGFADVKARLGVTIFQVASSDPRWAVAELLPMVKAAGLTVTLRMTDDHEAYTVNGDFNVDAWKAQVARWRGSGVQAYIDDGTLAGHMLLDDVTNFEGHDPTASELDEMARYSKELMPGLMTFVRQKATALPSPEGGRYRYVDAAVNQYEVMEGDVREYATHQATRAQELGIGVINGLNIADGGDGSSGRPGYRAGHHPMTAAEIRTYGDVLVRVPTCGMFLNWEYDGEEQWSDGTIGAVYLDDPEIQAALAGLAVQLARHRAVPLLRPSP